MRSHRDGYIQASKLEIELPDAVVWRAFRVGATLLTGVQREVEDYLGIRIEEPERVRMITNMSDGVRTIRIESSWVRPSRR